MLHQLLVHATDLTEWANRLESKHIFPELIRRLIFATSSNITHIDFASGEGVQLGGWDGITTSNPGTAFVPEGIAGWELGTDKNPKGKADKDYIKRTGNPLELVQAETTYIFVTLRRWGNKNKWAASRKAEGVWKDVRAYDADNLATWLAEAPAVHIWLSGLLGKRPSGIQDLTLFWDQWSAVTKPKIPPALLLAGRQESIEKLQNWVTTKSGSFSLQADTREEAIAILAAATMALPDPKAQACFARAVVVRSPQIWDELVTTGQSLLLISLFNEAEAVAGAGMNGHQVFLPVDHTEFHRNTENLPRLAIDPARKALMDIGLTRERAEKLAGLARRSMAAFRRKLAFTPAGKQPAWCSAANSLVLLAATLAGAWDESHDPDNDILEKLVNRPYEEIQVELIHFSHLAEPPVRRIGTTWYVVDKADVWSLLARFQTDTLLPRFSEIILQVLGTPLPKFDLPPDQRYLANVIGKGNPHSNALRKGLADTLAMLGADVADNTSRYKDPEPIIRQTVRELLRRANEDSTLWGSLAYLLTYLAEAAPEEFLVGVESGITDLTSPIMSLFKVQKGIFYDGPNHTGLLRALEVLAWSPSYLSYTTKMLARLTRLDSGGNVYPRPYSSLLEIYLWWFPHTKATLIQRLAAIDLLRQSEPEAAWNFLMSLIPNGTNRTSSGTEKPAWRDWAPEPIIPLAAEDYHKAIEEVINRVLIDVGNNTSRWASLIGNLPYLYPHQRKQAIGNLLDLSKSSIEEEQRVILQKELRRVIHNHRSYSKTDRPTAKAEIDLLEKAYHNLMPEDLNNRYYWLFSNWPFLLSGERKNTDKYQQEINAERLAALSKIYKSAGIDGILAIIPHIEESHSLGRTLSESKLLSEFVQNDLLQRFLAHEDPKNKYFAWGLADSLVRERGEEWGYEKLRKNKVNWSAPQQAAWLYSFRSSAMVWNVARELGEETEKGYWQLQSPYGITKEDAEEAFKAFCRYGRPLTALHLAQTGIHKGSIPAPLLADALVAALSQASDFNQNERLDSDSLFDIINFIANSNEVETHLVAQLEFGLLSIHALDRPKPIILDQELASNPKFFSYILRMFTHSEDGNDPASAHEDVRINAFKLLQEWRTIPGMDKDGSINGEDLTEWIREAQRITTEIGRGILGEGFIGQMLSASPPGVDGVWPHETIRDVIETMATPEIERGFEMGKFNSRGATWRNPYTGGNLEREIVKEFSAYAKAMEIRWPRTAAIMRRLARTYQDMAIREDNQADLEQDLNL